MTRLTRVQQQERTHERLLAAGRTVFVRRGFLATTVEEIATEAGYTRGAVYKHFGGKEGLWLAITVTYAEQHLQSLREGLERAGSQDELIAALIPHGGLADEDLARWVVASAEFLAAVTGQPEYAAVVATAQQSHDEEVVALLTRHCDRLHIQPAVPLPELVAAVGALGAGLALRRAVDPAVDVAAIGARLLAAMLPSAVVGTS